MRSAVALSLLCAACATTPRARPTAPSPVAAAGPLGLVAVAPPELDDDLPLAPLLDAVEAHAVVLERSSRVAELRFGARVVGKAEYVATLRRFVAAGRAAASPRELWEAVRRDFQFYVARFEKPLLVTSYYEPILDGAHAPSARFSQALYRPPPDAPTPGYTRAEIDSGHKLAGRGLELCWVDPFDAFVLQTEGSGKVRFADGSTVALDVAGSNGHAHARLAPFLAGAIPPARMNMHTIEAYLRGLPVDEMRRILEKNPRYIFFRPRAGAGAATWLGAIATDGRSIAADPAFVPKGALAFLVTTQPRFDASDAAVPRTFVPLRRFVLDEDTGSGIKGARVDLFWGTGAEARLYAGAMKQQGEIYYLAPREVR